MRITFPILICATSLLGGCVTNGNTPADTYCNVYDPIRASKLDTPETLKQVKRQNRAYDALCKRAMKAAAEEMLAK